MYYYGETEINSSSVVTVTAMGLVVFPVTARPELVFLYLYYGNLPTLPLRKTTSHSLIYLYSVQSRTTSTKHKQVPAFTKQLQTLSRH